MRRHLASLLIVVLCAALPAWATDSVAAAGRLDYEATGGSCSAAVVAPGIVATAAHCVPTADDLATTLFVVASGQPGAALDRAAQHSMYGIEGQPQAWQLRFDIGAVRLETPEALSDVEPFPLGEDARQGETLYIVSWLRGRGDRPRQRACPVLGTHIPGLVTLGCSVEGGESGAPVLRKTERGLELVAIVSSRTNLLNQPVAHASNVRLRLPPLILEMQDNGGS